MNDHVETGGAVSEQLPDVGDPWDGVQAPEGFDDVCDGAGDTLEAAERPPSSRGWGPGWPHCQTGELRTVPAGPGVRLSVRRELAPLVQRLCAETVERGYALREGQCWGFACRPIRGSQVPSNHSWGLAVDLNSLANPMGPRLVTDMPRWLPALWKEHGFRWGGDYTRRKDAMHFEFMGTRDEALGPAPRRSGERMGVSFEDFDDRAKPTSRTLQHGSAGADVAFLQRWLGLADDGYFGPVTEQAVKRYQTKHGLDDDGIVGPATWKELDVLR